MINEQQFHDWIHSVVERAFLSETISWEDVLREHLHRRIEDALRNQGYNEDLVSDIAATAVCEFMNFAKELAAC